MNNTDAGASGSWVVRKDRLCGVVVARYEDEPFAYMITAESLLNDINKTYLFQRWVQVRLWR